MSAVTNKANSEVHITSVSDESPKLPSPNGDPVAKPVPPMDGKKPIAAGDLEVEKFLVATDSGGGE